MLIENKITQWNQIVLFYFYCQNCKEIYIYYKYLFRYDYHKWYYCRFYRNDHLYDYSYGHNYFQYIFCINFFICSWLRDYSIGSIFLLLWCQVTGWLFISWKKKQQNKSAAHEIRAGSGHVTFSSNRVIFICSLDAGVFATSGRVAIATRTSSTQIH